MAAVDDTISVGKQRLHRITVSAEQPWARIAVAHGYGDHAGRYLEFMTWLAERGVSCQAIDFHGQGKSTGAHGAIRRWEDYFDDLAAICPHTTGESPESAELPLFVVGHSHGGLVVLAAAIQGRLKCAGVIVSSPFLKLRMRVSLWKEIVTAVGSVVAPALQVRSGVGALDLSRDPEMVAQTRADPYCKGIATPSWFAQVRRVQAGVRARANEFITPLLMLIAGDDSVTEAAASIDFFQRTGSNIKTLKEYPGHRHELLRELGREAIFADIRGWMETVSGAGR